LPDVKDVLEAIEIQQQYKLSFWDSLIICSAKKSGCDVIWTEDLNNGQRYEGVVVLNPFSG
jgi:predicted nucleic acid-binding protein